MIDALSKISGLELCRFDGIDQRMLTNIVDFGIVEPVAGATVVDWEFDTSNIYWIKQAAKLYEGLELDWIAIVIVVDLLKKIEFLSMENTEYKYRMEQVVERVH